MVEYGADWTSQREMSIDQSINIIARALPVGEL